MARMPLPTGPPTPSRDPIARYNEGDYRYELFPDLSVLVYKEGQLSYSVDTVGCECPGFKHRGTCKHWTQRERMVAAHVRRGSA